MFYCQRWVLNTVKETSTKVAGNFHILDHPPSFSGYCLYIAESKVSFSFTKTRGSFSLFDAQHTFTDTGTHGLFGSLLLGNAEIRNLLKK